jgi:hypothetical protein
MKNKNRVGLFCALVALSLSMLNLGLIISKNRYKPQVVKLEQQVDELKKENQSLFIKLIMLVVSLSEQSQKKLLLMGIIQSQLELMASFLLRKNSMRVSMWATMPQAI